jgi:hypothetical protein
MPFCECPPGPCHCLRGWRWGSSGWCASRSRLSISTTPGPRRSIQKMHNRSLFWKCEHLAQRIRIINRSSRLTFCRPKLLHILSPCVLSPPPPPHTIADLPLPASCFSSPRHSVHRERIWSSFRRQKVERGLLLLIHILWFSQNDFFFLTGIYCTYFNAASGVVAASRVVAKLDTNRQLSDYSGSGLTMMPDWRDGLTVEGRMSV